MNDENIDVNRFYLLEMALRNGFTLKEFAEKGLEKIAKRGFSGDIDVQLAEQGLLILYKVDLQIERNEPTDTIPVEYWN